MVLAHLQISLTLLKVVASSEWPQFISLNVDRLHSATISRVKNNPETAYSGSDRFLRADSEFGVEIEILWTVFAQFAKKPRKVNFLRFFL